MILNFKEYIIFKIKEVFVILLEKKFILLIKTGCFSITVKISV